MYFATSADLGRGIGWMTIRLLPLQPDPGFKPYQGDKSDVHTCCLRRQGSVLVILHPLGTHWGDLVHTDMFNLKLHCTQAAEDMVQKCAMNAELNTYLKGKVAVFCFFFSSCNLFLKLLNF